ncbi:MAG: DUF4382 domain-containing protein [Flavobacteriaceae bacterium]|nr:DUF4382 domain-containing protein [Flavobacteriaceae bacterium]
MKFKTLFISLFTVALLVLSCSNDSDSSDTGRLIIQLTDAPFPHDLVAEANVTIYKIEARHKGVQMDEMMEEANSDDDLEGTSEENNSPYITLMEEEVSVNLLELTNGITETLVNTEIPVGTIDLLRIYVKGVSVVLEDGTTFDLNVPSGAQTGIKVFIKPPLAIEGGLTADLLLDFDVSRSFVKRGNGSLGFHFKPVIKASNMSTAGSIAGLVSTLQDETSVGLEGAQITLIAADTVNTTTFTDASGMYMLLGVEGGSYDVMVELEGYDPQTAEGVNVIPANKTTVDFDLEPTP